MQLISMWLRPERQGKGKPDIQVLVTEWRVDDKRMMLFQRPIAAAPGNSHQDFVNQLIKTANALLEAADQVSEGGGESLTIPISDPWWKGILRRKKG